MILDVPFSMLSSGAEAPSYAYAGDAGLDLRTTHDIELKPFERMTVSCGFAMAIPEGYAGLVIPRSGLAAKHGVSVVNGPGLIDSGYRGEIKVVLVNLDAHEIFRAAAGDRIAQLMIVATPQVNLRETDSLESSQRGEGGFGSSGI